MPRSACFATLAAGLLLPAAVLADAQTAPKLLALKETSLSYGVVHLLHKVSATCKSAEGAAKVNPGGPVQVQVRAKVACFDSGDSNRDVHMREVTHEPVHPFVSVKGTIDGLAFPVGASVTKTLVAKIELNGETQTVTTPVELVPEGNKLRAKFKFPVSLEGFKVERPSLLLVKVEDALTIEGDLVFE